MIPTAGLVIPNSMTVQQFSVGCRKRVVAPTLGIAFSLETAVVFSYFMGI